MIPIWPASLTRPMRSGWAHALADGRQSTRPEAGPPRVRRRFSAAVSTIQMAIDLSLDQRQLFNGFWRDTTRGGSLPFWIPDWTLDGVALTTEDGSGLLTEAGAPLLVSAWHLAMFGTDQPPSETVVGVRFRIAISLSIMP